MSISGPKSNSDPLLPSSATPRQRSQIYGLLSLLYRREPDKAFIDFLGKHELCDSLVEAVWPPGEKGRQVDSAGEAVEELALDYTSLFVTPGRRISLNESIYHHEAGQFLGKSAVEVKDFLESLGMTIDCEWRGLADHISIEFEIMRKLAECESRALEEADRTISQKSHVLQVDFFGSHISTWVPRICDRIMTRAESSFYKELAILTKVFIDCECQSLSQGRRSVCRRRKDNDED